MDWNLFGNNKKSTRFILRSRAFCFCCPSFSFFVNLFLPTRLHRNLVLAFCFCRSLSWAVAFCFYCPSSSFVVLLRPNLHHRRCVLAFCFSSFSSFGPFWVPFDLLQKCKTCLNVQTSTCVSCGKEKSRCELSSAHWNKR